MQFVGIDADVYARWGDLAFLTHDFLLYSFPRIPLRLHYLSANFCDSVNCCPARFCIALYDSSLPHAILFAKAAARMVSDSSQRNERTTSTPPRLEAASSPYSVFGPCLTVIPLAPRGGIALPIPEKGEAKTPKTGQIKSGFHLLFTQKNRSEAYLVPPQPIFK